MIKSMTGFYKTESTTNDVSCNIEIRSVNHRFLEAKIRLPNQFKQLEAGLLRQVKSTLARGKVDISIKLDQESRPLEKIGLNPVMMENVKELAGKFESELGKEVSVGLSDLFQIKELIVFEKEELDMDVYQALFEKSIADGVNGLVAMRQREGELLYAEIITHIEKLAVYIEEIPSYRNEVIANYQARLKKNLKELELKYDADNPRIIQEIGIFLDRSDITEEIERFRTHLTHFKELLVSDEAVGRKLDFMLQEFNREANTLSSKSSHTTIAKLGVELKCEIEKIREQIQNIEMIGEHSVNDVSNMYAFPRRAWERAETPRIPRSHALRGNA